MTIKVYISGISGSHEVRKHQQRVLFILQSLPIDLQVIDITEPGREDDLIFMQEEAKKHDKKTQLPPQIFNGNEYCGDYADFELANDDDELMRFLKLKETLSKAENITRNGVSEHGNYQENTNAVEESILNNVEDNIVTNIQEPDSNEVESNLDQKKDTIFGISEKENDDMEIFGNNESAEENKINISESDEESEKNM